VLLRRLGREGAARARLAEVTGQDMLAHLARLPFLAGARRRISLVRRPRSRARCADATPQQQQLAASLFRYRAVPSGAVVFEQGDIGREMCFVASGRLRVGAAAAAAAAAAERATDRPRAQVTAVSADDEAGRGRELAELGAGAHFGEIALLVNLPRTATVTAAAPSLLLALDKADFEALLHVLPAAGEALARLARQRIAEQFRAFEAPFFRAVPPALLAELAAVCACEEFAADAVVFREGEEGARFYIVVFGQAKAVRRRGNAWETLAVLGPGKYFGESECGAARLRAAHVRPLSLSLPRAPTRSRAAARREARRDSGHSEPLRVALRLQRRVCTRPSARARRRRRPPASHSSPQLPPRVPCLSARVRRL
jgi:CRP-like cAMP-binding protein